MFRPTLTLLAVLAALIGCKRPDAAICAAGRGAATAALARTVTVGQDAEPSAPDCLTCNDKGYLPVGDTGRKKDCPDCDLDTLKDVSRVKQAGAAESPATPPTEPQASKADTPAAPAPKFNADFGGDLRAAEAAARSTGRVVFVAFTAPWCGPCHQFHDRVLADERVQARLAGTACVVTIDIDQQPKVAERFGVTQIPRFYVYCPGGVRSRPPRQVPLDPAQWLQWYEATRTEVLRQSRERLNRSA